MSAAALRSMKATNEPESDDDECELTKALEDCGDPTGEDALEDDSITHGMTLKEARAASRALQLFLEEEQVCYRSRGATRNHCCS